ncbi:hypothetical protein Bca52824_024570 [Brassica carinata]|uniref:Endonuclease/exonuclease/phosphatase domain-containing protein n=1 Tax=Brassica carinata TaxID=52824 RepID=A0A8X8AVX7_BRACI|nr:hypothetical protein Bca52824_024570 [Brassica carinata]
MKTDIELPTEDVTEVEFEYMKIEKHCFTCFSLFHEEAACPHRPVNALPPKERLLGITQRIALQRIEAEKKRHDDRRGYRRFDDSRSFSRHHEDRYELAGRSRASDRSCYDRRESQQRKPSILSRTARSNSASVRTKYPSFEYRVVEHNRPSTGSSVPHQIPPIFEEGIDLRNSLPTLEERAISTTPKAEGSPKRTIKERLVGLSGGLSLLWDDETDITILESSPNLIDVRIVYKGTSSFVSFVYGAPATENRASFWNKLGVVGQGRDDPWLLTGDFNDILNNAEKVGGPIRPEGSFSAFRSFVTQNGLWDLKHSGEHLSWRGNRHTHFIRSRLDRAMGNCSWAEAYPMGRCRYLRFEGSDHRPLMTYFNGEKPKRRGMFRFNRALTEQEEVTGIIDEAWNASPLDSVILKLNKCRRSIILWAKEQQSQSNLIIKQTQEALERALSDPFPDTCLIESLNSDLRKAYLAEEQFWLQRSRIQWLKQGDKNTGFFHAATRTRRTINAISVIEDTQGGAVYEEHEIARMPPGMQGQNVAELGEFFQVKLLSYYQQYRKLIPMSHQHLWQRPLRFIVR